MPHIYVLGLGSRGMRQLQNPQIRKELEYLDPLHILYPNKPSPPNTRYARDTAPNKSRFEGNHEATSELVQACKFVWQE